MNERVEKYKFHRQLRKIDWNSVINSVIKATKQTSKTEEHK